VLSAQVTRSQGIERQTFTTIALARHSDGQEARVTTIESNNVLHLFLAGEASMRRSACATSALSETTG
jgi:hypothetical protein